MKIVVSERNFDRIAEKLEEAQATSRVRTACLQDVQNAIREAQSQPALYLTPKREWDVDIEYSVGFGGRIPASYNGIPECSVVHLSFKSGSWKFTGITRGKAKANESLKLTLSQDHADYAQEKFTETFNIA